MRPCVKNVSRTSSSKDFLASRVTFSVIKSFPRHSWLPQRRPSWDNARHATSWNLQWNFIRQMPRNLITCPSADRLQITSEAKLLMQRPQQDQNTSRWCFFFPESISCVVDTQSFLSGDNFPDVKRYADNYTTTLVLMTMNPYEKLLIRQTLKNTRLLSQCIHGEWKKRDKETTSFICKIETLTYTYIYICIDTYNYQGKQNQMQHTVRQTHRSSTHSTWFDCTRRYSSRHSS